MNITHRIQLAIDAESATVFVVPYGNAFLRVSAWECQDGDYDDENIRQIDLYGDKRCTKLISEEIEWQNLADLDTVFLDIRRQQFIREDRRCVQGFRRLWDDIQADAAVERMWGGA